MASPRLFCSSPLAPRIGFQVVHHVTFVNYWMPTFLALLPAPFVWGPVGGGESAPRSFLSSFSWRGRIHELLRTARGESPTGILLFDWPHAVRSWRSRPPKKPPPNYEALAVGMWECFLRSDWWTRRSASSRPSPRIVGLAFASSVSGTSWHLLRPTVGLRPSRRLHAQFPQSRVLAGGERLERKPLERLARRLGHPPECPPSG